jgi:hypothetical protein
MRRTGSTGGHYIRQHLCDCQETLEQWLGWRWSQSLGYEMTRDFQLARGDIWGDPTGLRVRLEDVDTYDYHFSVVGRTVAEALQSRRSITHFSFEFSDSLRFRHLVPGLGSPAFGALLFIWL